MSGSTPNTEPDRVLRETAIQVVAGVLRNQAGDVLVARRHADADQGGLWEFPGGKIEPGETAFEALDRELHEELGIRAIDTRPLIRVPHDYPHRRVVLDVYEVTRFQGDAHGREGQPVRWVPCEMLGELAFPAANQPIVNAVRLPRCVLVTPEPQHDAKAFLERLAWAARVHRPLIQLRAHGLSGERYEHLAREALAVAQRCQVPMLLNAPPSLCRTLGADGVHLTASALMTAQARPLDSRFRVSASCHSPQELRRAVQLGVDFVLLGPVRPTASHPQAQGIGLDLFRDWVRDVPLPVYALGGMEPGDWEAVRNAGGQGVAGIRAFWGG